MKRWFNYMVWRFFGTAYQRKLWIAGICRRHAGHNGPCNGYPRYIAQDLWCFNWPIRERAA